jgi:cardiolipin synthase
MRVPKVRNVLVAILIVAIVVAVGLLIAQDQETLKVRVPLSAEDARFHDYLARLAGRPATTGDSYAVLHNGDETFPAMLGAIDKATRRISFETYIFSEGDVSEQFTRALVAAARRGVQVQIVLDAIGTSDREKEHVEALRQAGAHIGLFNPVSHSTIEELNFRTHRKILVVDGEVGFVGGIGLADHWLGNAQSEEHWRDSQFEIRGPAVDNIEAGFQKNWIETGGLVEPIVGVRTDPPQGDARSTVVWSAAEAGFNSLKLTYLLAIGAARKTLDIQSPYFVVDESTLWSLYEARKRGVRIRVLTESDTTDAKPVKFAGRAFYEDLLEHGVEIYEYQPTMMHVKAMVVDGILSIIGSANFDNRSLELNDELNVVVTSRRLATQLTSDFDTDLKRSSRIDLEAWRSRPVHISAREKMWSFFGEIF